MKIPVFLYEFNDHFQSLRPDSFSYEGIKALFKHLDTEENEDLTLDVIAIDGEYAEYYIDELPKNFPELDAEDYEDWDAMDFVDFFSNQTVAIPVHNDAVILREF